jgi:hypothetical protein
MAHSSEAGSMKTLTPFEKDLLSMRSDDTINGTEKYHGFDVIDTAAHGYLVVPKNHEHYKKAQKICSYGYKGKLAVYLEEDCEAWEFLEAIRKDAAA